MGEISTRERQTFQKTDWWWLLGYPIYQVVGTMRHEASHALVAWLEGAQIVKIVLLPSWMEGKGFAWGYVRWKGQTDWLAIAAPYFVDLLTFLLFFFICKRLYFRRHWLWVNLVILGMISPLVNSLYNLLRASNPHSDVGRLLDVLPPAAVYSYFILTLGFYLYGLWQFMPRPAENV